MTIDHQLQTEEYRLSSAELEKIETNVAGDFEHNVEREPRKRNEASNSQIVKNLFRGFYKAEEHKTTNLTSKVSLTAAQASKPRTLNGKHYSTAREVLHAATYLLNDETAFDRENLADDVKSLLDTIGLIKQHKKFYHNKIDRETKEYAKTHSIDERMAYTQSQVRKRDHLFSQYDTVLDLVKKRRAYINNQLRGNSEKDLPYFLGKSENITHITEADFIENIEPRESPISIDESIKAAQGLVKKPQSIESAKVPANNGTELYAEPGKQTLKKRVGGWFNKGLSYFKRSA
jgi:hypothetical protein